MVETIVAALVGGLVAGAGKVASKGVEDACGALKGLIGRRFGARSEAAGALARLEAKPDRTDLAATLAEELKAVQAGADAEVMAAAARLQAALDALPEAARVPAQNAVGNFIAQADRGSTATVTIQR